MDAWGEVVRAALLGVEREGFAPPPAPDAVAAILGAAKGEEALLDCVAVLGTWQAAGRCAAEAPGLPGPFATETEELPVAPRSMGLLLHRVLSEETELLEEALGVLKARGWLAPPELLPQLLDVGLSVASTRGLVASVMGRRGAALAKLRPEWSKQLTGAEGLDAESWQGDLGARAAALARFRGVDPDAARALLQGAWKGEHAAARAKLLSTLDSGLCAGDEPILEACLDDKSQQVAQVAAGLLAKLPESGHVARMGERVRGLLRPGDGGRLDLEPPREIDAAARRDGLPSPRREDGSVVPGARQQLLFALASTARLEVWTSASGLSPAELIEAARASGWSLEHGWLEAALLQRDEEWARALVGSPTEGRMQHLDYERALAALPAAERDLFALGAASRDKGALLRLARLCDAPLSPGLTRALGGQLVELLPLVKPRGADARELLFELASRGAPSLYPELAAQVSARLPDDPASAAMVERAMRRLELRHQLHQEHAP